ncbi:hypothetical protein LY78DRAFT_109591 [Colletotrichum sublineola]|nr:hypothetical protein LY78DRAFT_109591 [Colletotrichum sublineola]
MARNMRTQPGTKNSRRRRALRTGLPFVCSHELTVVEEHLQRQVYCGGSIRGVGCRPRFRCPTSGPGFWVATYSDVGARQALPWLAFFVLDLSASCVSTAPFVLILVEVNLFFSPSGPSTITASTLY